jgi:hypothetical protein
VNVPLISETDENIWYLYYQDIFDAYQGRVAPPLEKYPTASYRAFNRAKEEWDKKVEAKKASGTPLVILAIGLAIIIIAAALLVPTTNRPNIKI